MSSLTIAQRIGLLAALLLTTTLLLGTITLFRVSHMDGVVHELRDANLPGIEDMGLISAKIYRIRGDAWKHIATHDAQKVGAIEGEILLLKKQLSEQLAAYDHVSHEPSDRANFDSLRQLIDQYFEGVEASLNLSRQGKGPEAYDTYIREADPRFVGLRDQLLIMQDWNKKEANAAADTASEAAASLRLWTWILLTGAFGGGLLTAFLLTRAINRSLRRAMADLASGAQQVAAAASQTATASQQLAQGASAQAAALQETTALSEEIRGMASRNNATSQEAATVATRSGDKFSQANVSLNEMVTAMAEINAQSDSISKIIKVIDEIAFQTNVLALNAAVEAARAGAAGMGFAVVAGQVRDLAQRCASAAKETTVLIEASIDKAASGKAKVAGLTETILGVRAEAIAVTDLTTQISLNSTEQATRIEEIARGLGRVEHVVQRTAAGAEEGAAAAQELQAQSAVLAEVVDRIGMMVGRAA